MTVDRSPLYRTAIGFDRLASMLESGDSLRVDVADHLQLAPKIRCCESFL